jgi:glycosyltransferase involved in cell wall biosynthesis
MAPLNIVEAFLLVRESMPDLGMVFRGGRFEENHPAAEGIRSHGLSNSVEHIGYRTPTEVRCLYLGARALAYPSLFEGFGMPVAEAIEVGTPVLCSDIEPLADIGGDAVVTFDPMEPKDIAEKIISVLQDDQLRVKLQRQGEEQRKRFSGEAITLQTCNLYRSCCGFDPLWEKNYPSKTAIRCGSTRHWGRVYERNFRARCRLSGMMALLVTA